MKNLKYLILVIALAIMLPVVVKADKAPVAFDGYSYETAVGAEIDFIIAGYADFDGKITYNKNELTLVKEGVYDPTFVEGAVEPLGEIKYTNKVDGEATFKFIKSDDASVSSVKKLRFTFKVKSASSNEIKIVYTPNDPAVLFGSPSYTRTYTVLGDKTKCVESTETTTNSTETNTETTETASNPPVVSATADNTLLYVSWGISGLLLVAVIVLALKKRQ